MFKLLRLIGAALAGSLAVVAPATAQTTDKPNILVIWGDDIGITNVSAYSRGMMGYQTPNIDRIANEGALFTDYYAEQSCTAGRAAFITGQLPYRTGHCQTNLSGPAKGAGLRRSGRQLTPLGQGGRTVLFEDVAAVEVTVVVEVVVD